MNIEFGIHVVWVKWNNTFTNNIISDVSIRMAYQLDSKRISIIK